MKIAPFLLGLLIGFVVTLIGSFAYVELATGFSFFKDISFLIQSELGGVKPVYCNIRLNRRV